MRALQFGLAAVASVAVVSAAVIALWLAGSATGERDKFSSLELAPHDAVFYVAINTDPASPQWLAVNDVLGALNAKDPIREAIDEELAKFDLEFERDILPLAGDEGYLAITDPEALSADEGGLVIAFQLRDPAKAEQIFLDLAAQEEAEYTEEVYEGETVYHAEGGFTGNTEDQGAMSVAGDTMVIGVVPDDVKGVIDVIQGRAPSAVGNERLQALRERQSEDFLVWGYGDVGRVLDVFREQLEQGLGESAGPTGLSSSEELFDQLRGYYDRLSFSVSARKDGFVVDMNAIQAEGADLPPAYGGTAFDSELIKRVPADAMAFFAGYDLYNGSYIPARDLMGQLSGTEGDSFDSAITDIEREIGFGLEDDLLSLMTGEFAVAFNASQLDASTPEFDVLAMIDINDRVKITDTMERVGDYLERQDFALTEDGSRGGVRLWSPLGAPESIAWTVDGDTLAVGYPESSVTGFLEGEGESLVDSADWKRTMGLLPDNKTSVLYLNLARILEEVRKVEGSEEQFETSTEGRFSLSDLAPVRTLAMASTTQDDRYGIRIVLLLEE